jgi:hypothetical protein
MRYLSLSKLAEVNGQQGPNREGRLSLTESSMEEGVDGGCVEERTACQVPMNEPYFDP